MGFLDPPGEGTRRGGGMEVIVDQTGPDWQKG
jgi:hypothetical protein